MSTPTGEPGQSYGSGDPQDTTRQQQYGDQQYGQTPYPPAGHGGAPPQAPRNGLGVAALVLGIIGLLLVVTFVLFWLGGLLGLLAVVFGFVGMSRAKKGQATNRGVAIGGLVTGILAVVGAIVITVLTVFLFNAAGGTELLTCIQQAGQDQAAQQACSEQFGQQIQQQVQPTN